MEDRVGKYVPWSYLPGLKTVIIEEGVTSIGACAFRDGDRLMSVTIPSSVTSIGSSAFYGCDSLTDIYYGGSEEQWNQITVKGSNDPLFSAAIHYNS